MGIVGGYTLDLYCDKENEKHGYDEFPHQFYGVSGPFTRQVARCYGWRLRVSVDLAICPKCSGLMPKKTFRDAKIR